MKFLFVVPIADLKINISDMILNVQESLIRLPYRWIGMKMFSH